MKYIIFLLFYTTSLFSLTINDSLLKVHATLVPKIYLMDYKFKQKIEHNSIVIILLYDKLDYKNAQSLKSKIDFKYQNGIKSYSVETKLVPYNKISNTNANIYYLFPTSEKNIKKTINIAKVNESLTFSYLKNDLKYGIMLSLNIGNKITPIINLDAIKTSSITLRPVLLDISYIYKTGSKNNYLNFESKWLNNNIAYLVLLDTIKQADIMTEV